MACEYMRVIRQRYELSNDSLQQWVREAWPAGKPEIVSVDMPTGSMMNLTVVLPHPGGEMARLRVAVPIKREPVRQPVMAWQYVNPLSVVTEERWVFDGNDAYVFETFHTAAFFERYMRERGVDLPSSYYGDVGGITTLPAPSTRPFEEYLAAAAPPVRVLPPSSAVSMKELLDAGQAAPDENKPLEKYYVKVETHEGYHYETRYRQRAEKPPPPEEKPSEQEELVTLLLARLRKEAGL